MNTEVLIDKLTKAVSHRYRDDKTAPGLTVSALKKGYYCSVVRYEGPFARNKVVVCKAKGDSLSATLKDLTTQFLNDQTGPVDPIQELRNSFNHHTVFRDD